MPPVPTPVTPSGPHRRPPFPPQLTATKAGRILLREKGTYVVLRELHRCEKEPEVLSACERLIQVGAGTGQPHGLGGRRGVNGVGRWSWCHLAAVGQGLIGDEPEPGMENLLEVEIPEEVEERLRRWDGEEEEERRRREEER